VDDMVSTCTSYDAALRYQSVEELERALSPLLKNESG
jgi:hypothetical protein